MNDQAISAAVVIRSGLDEQQLVALITDQHISRERIIAITEPVKGTFTLIWEPVLDLDPTGPTTASA